MADFNVEVVVLDDVSAHPDADRLDIAMIGDYQCIVGKGTYQTGDKVAYIPEQALVPLEVQKVIGVEGRLAGSAKNRVKAIRLRKVLSQGLVYPAKDSWEVGQDVTEELGITKWEPHIPVNMSGVCAPTGDLRRTVRYDINNIKKYNKALEEGEPVRIVEKVHGSFCSVGVIAEDLLEEGDSRVIAHSKGLGKRGVYFDMNSEDNSGNVYVRVAKEYDILTKVLMAYPELPSDTSVFVLGEVFGSGIQDLSYGASAHESASEDLGFRVFDVLIRKGYEDTYLGDAELTAFCDAAGLEQVPVLYRGPYSKEILLQHTSGKETVSGKGLHIREGVVVRPLVERNDYRGNRVQYKSVSAEYLLRKSGTEFS